MRVLGIDPGLTRCGVGIVDGEIGRQPQLVAVGVVRTSASADVASRLAEVEAGLELWFDEYRPDVVAVERVFAQQNLSRWLQEPRSLPIMADYLKPAVRVWTLEQKARLLADACQLDGEELTAYLRERRSALCDEHRDRIEASRAGSATTR